MSLSVSSAQRKGIFYGWWILVAGTVINAVQSGVVFYGFSAFYMPLKNEFKWSATVLSGAVSLSRLESGIAGPVVGYLIDRFGPRVLMAIGIPLTGVGFILLSRINSVEMFYIIFIFAVSLPSSFGFNPPINAAVANWFVRKRSMAFGIMTCGVGVGGFAVPVLAWLIGQYGWRQTAIGAGLMFIVIGVPIALTMRHKPEQYGYLPDGASPRPATEEAREKEVATGAHEAAAPAVDDEVSFTPRQALNTSAFWMLAFTFTIRQFLTNGVAVHEMPALVNVGFSPEIAALSISALTMVSIPGRIVFGWLGDRVDKRYAIGLCFVLQFAGLLAFAYTSDYVMLIVFLLLYAPAYGGLVPLMPAAWGQYYGRKSFATISGLSQTVTMWGNILGPLMAGFTFDLTGSYQSAFLFFAATNLLGVVLLLLVRRPRLKTAPERATVAAA